MGAKKSGELYPKVRIEKAVNPTITKVGAKKNEKGLSIFAQPFIKIFGVDILNKSYEIKKNAFSKSEVFLNSIPKCPICKSTNIVIQKGNGNDIYGCDFIALVCNNCKIIYGFNDVVYKPNTKREI